MPGKPAPRVRPRCPETPCVLKLEDGRLIPRPLRPRVRPAPSGPRKAAPGKSPRTAGPGGVPAPDGPLQASAN